MRNTFKIIGEPPILDIMPPSTPPGRPASAIPSSSGTTQDEPGFLAPLDVDNIKSFLLEVAPTTQTALEGLISQDAIDASIESALICIDIAYVPRDIEAPFTTVAVSNGSWLQEEPPVPCTMDSWLRSVMPETHPMPKTSYAMSQFLQQQNQGASFKRGSVTSESVKSASLAGSPEPGSPSKTPLTSKGGRTRPAVSGAGNMQTERSSILASPDVKKQEDRLRDELLVRRHQAQAAADLEAEDAAQKARIVQLSKDLRGKEYSYDHKGQVTVLENLGKEGKDQELAYRLTLPQPSDHEVAGGGRVSPTKMRKNIPSPTPNAPKGTRASQAAEKERKLATDYKESKPTSQPSALETLRPNAGVMLRQGGQSKAGPAGARALEGVSKDELARMKAKQATAAPPELTSNLQPPAAKSFTFSSPLTATPTFTYESPPSGLVGSLADAPSAFFGATLKPTSASEANAAMLSKNVSSIDTINSMLLNAPDWGSGGGVGVTSVGSSMQPVKIPPVAKMQRDRLPPVTLGTSGKITSAKV